jgi:hypothetical protein
MSVEQLEAAVVALGGLLSEVVFLGGATVGLWSTDPAARPARVTLDVDVVAEVYSLGDYERFQAALRARGFSEDIDSGVICRWNGPGDLVLDAVPADTRLAGMSGRWLRPAIEAATRYVLPSGVTIRVVSPAWLLVLKLEAFGDRGADDPLESRDFEDLVLLVDGREELLAEVGRLSIQARDYGGGQLTRVNSLPDFDYGVEGALLGPDGRARALEVTLPRLAELARD